MAEDQNQDIEYISLPSSSYSNVPLPPSRDRADFVDKIKPEQIVELIRHKLLGEEFNGSNWVKVQALQKNALSERGAWEISNMMLAVSSINVSISKINSNQINARLRNLTKEVMVKCLSNWKEYNINDVGQLYYIKSLVFGNSLGSLSQAGEGSIQELFKTTVQENRNITTEKKEAGKIKRLLGMGGNG